MQLIDHDLWDLYPTPDGFVGRKSVNASEERYYFWSGETLHECTIHDFLLAKYGPQYPVLPFVDSDWTDAVAQLNHFDTVAICHFQESIIRVFDRAGQLQLELDVVQAQRMCAMGIYGLALTEQSIWCVDACCGTVLEFSPHGELVATLGEPGCDLFCYPEEIYAYHNRIYVCDMSHQRIACIDPVSHAVTTYRQFNEPVWELIWAAGSEYVRLQSGVYLLTPHDK